jgi:hypothetical protein
MLRKQCSHRLLPKCDAFFTDLQLLKISLFEYDYPDFILSFKRYTTHRIKVKAESMKEARRTIYF